MRMHCSLEPLGLGYLRKQGLDQTLHLIQNDKSVLICF